MNTQQALQHVESSVPERKPPSVADMLQAVVEKGITAENVGAMEKLVDLYERMQEREAEKLFAAAFVALQSEMPGVQAKKAVPNRDGTVRYRFAPYEEIMEQVRPLLQKHGFTVEFSTEFSEGRLTKLCTLQHLGGHKRTNKFAVRIGNGPPNASEAQADGAASTYAKRFALCDALNIVVETDDDPRTEGDSITEDQAEELLRRVIESDSNAPAFLKFCGVTAEKAGLDEFRKIPASRYDSADQMLRRKEQKGR